MYKSSSAKSWRKYNNRYQINGVKCTNCGKKYFPPVQICRDCGKTELIKYTFKEKGTLVTWSKLYSAPSGYEKSLPYIVGIIELEDKERFTTQIVEIDEEDLTFGMTLVPTFRKIFTNGEDGIINYGLVFTRETRNS